MNGSPVAVPPRVAAKYLPCPPTVFDALAKPFEAFPDIQRRAGDNLPFFSFSDPDFFIGPKTPAIKCCSLKFFIMVDGNEKSDLPTWTGCANRGAPRQTKMPLGSSGRQMSRRVSLTHGSSECAGAREKTLKTKALKNFSRS